MSKYDGFALVRRVIDAGRGASVASFRLSARLNGGFSGAAFIAVDGRRADAPR
ncbi:hypothetical protein [Pseudogulbenkiania ferrooxidans]|uniref:hypothetical protein n=1 Tax=Pseudogulbenkiania ferrooxidans TaxID=549169 RepID=UPI0013770F06|nr:hypothetical protein [Pseudogulbenkiania ferrooxidans]